MSDFQEECKRQLLGAAETLFSAPRPRPVARRWHKPPVFAAVALALLLLAAAAYAAGRLIGVGAPLRASNGAERRSRTAGVGEPVPAAGAGARSAQLLPISVADPGGGLPWGMRIVTTTRGLLCVQVGRLLYGRLGVLGQEGRSHDDGLFHELPAGALEQSSCSQPGVLVLYNTARERRQLAFGLLGPHALSVSYETAHRPHRVATRGSHGAYLIVLPAAPGGVIRGAPTEAAFVSPEQVPDAAAESFLLSAIEFRLDGHRCEIGSGREPSTPRCASAVTGAASPSPTATRRLRSRVALKARKAKGGYVLSLSFTAPVAVNDASSAYAAEYGPPKGRFCHAGTVGEPIERDIARGQRVHLTMFLSSQPGCHGPIGGRIVFGRQSSAASGPTYDETTVGSFSFDLPPTGS